MKSEKTNSEKEKILKIIENIKTTPKRDMDTSQLFLIQNINVIKTAKLLKKMTI
jgi:hypothetical protein